MYDIPSQANGGSTEVDASEYNSVQGELESLITQTGQSLPVYPASDIPNQLSKSVAMISRSAEYTDSGSANSYILNQSSSYTEIESYFNGLTVDFIPANTNTGNSTAKIGSLTAKKIYTGNSTLSAGDLKSGVLYKLIYDSTLDGGAGGWKLESSINLSTASQTKKGNLTIGEELTITGASYSGPTVTVPVDNTFTDDNIGDNIYISGVTDSGGEIVSGTFTIDDYTSTTVDYIVPTAPTGTLSVSSATLKHGDFKVYGVAQNFLSTENYFHSQVQQPSGTSVGSSTGAYVDIKFNTILENTISGLSLNATTGEITLPAGTYVIDATNMAYRVNNTKSRIRNTSDTIDYLGFSGFQGGSSDNIGIERTTTEKITIISPKNFKFQIYTQTGTATGLGKASSQGTEVFGDIKIYKVG